MESINSFGDDYDVEDRIDQDPAGQDEAPTMLQYLERLDTAMPSRRAQRALEIAQRELAQRKLRRMDRVIAAAVGLQKPGEEL